MNITVAAVIAIFLGWLAIVGHGVAVAQQEQKSVVAVFSPELSSQQHLRLQAEYEARYGMYAWERQLDRSAYAAEISQLMPLMSTNKQVTTVLLSLPLSMTEPALHQWLKERVSGTLQLYPVPNDQKENQPLVWWQIAVALAVVGVALSRWWQSKNRLYRLRRDQGICEDMGWSSRVLKKNLLWGFCRHWLWSYWWSACLVLVGFEVVAQLTMAGSMSSIMVVLQASLGLYVAWVCIDVLFSAAILRLWD